MQTVLDSNHRKTRSRRWWPAAAVAIILLLGVVGWLAATRQAAGQATGGTLDGEIVTAATGDLAVGIAATGQITPQSEASLALEIGGTVTEVYVGVGDAVAAGDRLVQLDTAGLARAVANARQALIIQEANLAQLVEPAGAADIAAAEAAVASAQQALAEALAGPDDAAVSSAAAGVNSASIRAAEASLLSAEQQYTSAVDAYNTAWDEGRDWELDDPQRADRLEAERENSANSLALAEANLASARAALDSAYAQYEAANASYADVLAGSSTAQIAALEASLAQAEATLEQLLSGPSDANLAIATAQVEQARLNLLDAEENLANATLTAPYDGLITAVHVAAGEQASGLAVDIVSAADLELVLSVDENDLALVTPGQAAMVTLEAYPQQPIAGEVLAVDPTGQTNSSGIVTFAVRVALNTTDIPLLPGMTGDAELLTAGREDVLLVPNAALTANRSAGTVTVQRIIRSIDGTLSSETVLVTAGISDGDYTEIISGLAAGDEVLIGTLTAPAEEGGFGPRGL